MGIEYKDSKMINTCDWPDCGCQEEVEWRYDKGWASYTGFAEDLREIYGLPDSGMLCLHHQDAIDAYETGDWELLRLLTSI